MVKFLLALVYLHLTRGTYIDTSIFGNIDLGYYYVELWVGTPPVRQTLAVTVGTSITAIPCMDCTECGTHLNNYFNYKNSSTSIVLPCTPSIRCLSCNSQQDFCRYGRSFSEGSSISGYYIQDSVIFGHELNIKNSVNFTFGCNTRETDMIRSQLADGIMGLGIKDFEINIVEALFKGNATSKKLFSICLANENGFMTIGGYNESRHNDEIKWTSMKSVHYYTISTTGLKVNGLDSGLEESEFSRSGSFETIIDSGITFTFLTYAVYKTLYEKFDEFCSLEGNCKGQEIKTAGEPHVCYRFDEKLFSPEEFFSSFPEITFQFKDIEVVWRPERYLYAWSRRLFDYCVCVYNNGAAGNVLGGVFMRGHDVIFDNDNGMMGFALSDCGASWNDTFRDRARRAVEEYETKSRDWVLFNVVLFVTICFFVFTCGYLLEKWKFRPVKAQQDSVKRNSIEISS